MKIIIYWLSLSLLLRGSCRISSLFREWNDPESRIQSRPCHISYTIKEEIGSIIVLSLSLRYPLESPIFFFLFKDFRHAPASSFCIYTSYVIHSLLSFCLNSSIYSKCVRTKINSSLPKEKNMHINMSHGAELYTDSAESRTIYT